MMSSAVTPRAVRLDSLTGLRWWAAFAVFFYHVRNFIPVPGWFGELAQYGYLGVTFFFVLSGFVLTWSWRPGVGIGTFYWRRIARIFPLHLVTLALAIPVFYSLAPDPADTWVKPFDVGVLLLSLLLLQGWSRDPAVLFAGNPAAWTLTAELFFYALHPFIMKVLRLFNSRHALSTAVGILLLSIGARVLITLQPGGMLAELPWPVLRLNEFIIGMCLAWAFRAGWRPRIPLWIPILLLGGYVMGLGFFDRYALTQPLHVLSNIFISEIVTALFALLICAFATNDLAGRSRLSRARPLIALGEWSYAFYLIHATFIYGALKLLGFQNPDLIGASWVVVLLAISIAASWILHIAVERPAERGLRTWQRGIVDRRAQQRVTR
jgi:peptidoglycan/LPS O-acetylase OafA/YrhL